MTLTVIAAIPDALLAHLTSFAEAQSPQLDVSYPDEPFTPTDDVAYLEATYLPNATETRAIASNGSQLYPGLLQVAVMWPRGGGAILDAYDLAGAILAHFAKGTLLYSNDFQVRIDRAGSVAAYLQEDTRLRVPVTIPFACFAAPATTSP